MVSPDIINYMSIQPTILTGVRANNDLTLGNYFGAILPTVRMAQQRADDFTINMFIPDLHSFTTPIDHTELQKQIMHNARIFIAAGLPVSHPNVHLYRQSYIPAHSELTWILDCFTGFGEMSRMTQFKDKSASLGGDRVTVGLFNYPVLMASDILLYNASYVPVGDDQTQHLEFARDIAERINKKFGAILQVPKPVHEQHAFFGRQKGLRIMDLQHPTKKMSKSDESGKGVIFLSDSPKAAHKKIMSATTDSLGAIAYDPAQQPGISNLLELLSIIRQQPLAEVAAEFAGQQRYGDFKRIVADAVAAFLAEFQQRLALVDDETIETALTTSEEAVRPVAEDALLRVQKAVGLRA